MSDRPKDRAPAEEEPELTEEDWAAEIKRLRAARGQKLAERLAEEGDKKPPVGP